MNVVPTTTLRNNISLTMEALSKDMEYMLVSNRGKIVSALVNIDFFEELMAGRSKKYKSDIKRARQEAKESKLHTMEEVFGDI